jgi:ABC-type antimicrobial peptide transport system permease subunit
VVIGKELAKMTFGKINPIGKDVYFENQRVKVVGVLKKKEKTFLISDVLDDYTIYLPFNFQKEIVGTEKVDVVYFKAKSLSKINEAEAEIKNWLKNLKKENFVIKKLDLIILKLKRIMGIVSLMVGSLALLSLIVGGIGIMNIMLAVVMERYKEIGIRKAVGATEKDILLQFTLESVILSFTGGIIGIFVGTLFLLMINFYANVFFQIEKNISILPLLYGSILGILFAILTGFIFGYYPARKAAKLNPVEALRWE